MKQDYALLAKFYRQLLKDRSFFEAQLNVIRTACRLFRIQKTARILDAACGTGDIACSLSHMGFRRVHATDGSSAMLSQWPAGEGRPQYEVLPWVKLHRFFEREGRFDLVYVLGNSIAHARPAQIHNMLKTINKQGLNRRGVLLFDIRPWCEDLRGQLTQPNRPKSRRCPPVIFDHKTWSLSEHVDYDFKQRLQIVDYRLVNQRLPKETRTARVTYSLFDWRQAAEWLHAAGFNPESVVALQVPGWSYVVLAAQK